MKNQEFIDNLIAKLETLKYKYKIYGGERSTPFQGNIGEEYYQKVGRIVCAKIKDTYDKDVEL